jgi:uroporphyrinogen-III synthase
MRVLVTRPEPGGRRTASRLVEMGHEPVNLPLFEPRITARTNDLPDANLIDAVVATSARAFDFLGGVAVPHAYQRIPVHVVGPATAQSASEAGFATIHEAGGTARELAKSLIAKSGAAQSPRHGSGDSQSAGSSRSAEGDRAGRTLRLLYLAGLPRKPSLEADLAGAGVLVTVLETYEMIQISYSTDSIMEEVFDPPPEAVLLYSANAADRLMELATIETLGKSLHSARFFCLSPDIRDRLPDPWRARATAAVRPDEDSLLASLAALG